MEIIAMPFIFVYHVVHYILLSPKRILSYAYSGVLAVIDKLSRGKITEKREKQKEVDKAVLEVEELMNASRINSKEKITIRKEPEISFRYKVKGSSGKIINNY